MASKRIRVYELARELGLSNKEALDLCERLRIGVKSHSSSIEGPQADRVRRLADSEGLRREVQPEEVETAPAKAEPPTPAPVGAPTGGDAAAGDVGGETAPPVHRVIRSTEGGVRQQPPRPAPAPE